MERTPINVRCLLHSSLLNREGKFHESPYNSENNQIGNNSGNIGTCGLRPHLRFKIFLLSSNLMLWSRLRGWHFAKGHSQRLSRPTINWVNQMRYHSFDLQSTLLRTMAKRQHCYSKHSILVITMPSGIFKWSKKITSKAIMKNWKEREIKQVGENRLLRDQEVMGETLCLIPIPTMAVHQVYYFPNFAFSICICVSMLWC